MRVRHGLAFGWLTIMVITLALFALMYAVLEQPVLELLDVGTQNANPSGDSAKGRRMARRAWEWSPLAVLLASAVALFARAIFESAQPGR